MVQATAPRRSSSRTRCATALKPLALAEFWWGPPPPTGDRRHGVFYPACRGKCVPILGHMLADIAEPPPVYEQPTAASCASLCRTTS